MKIYIAEDEPLAAAKLKLFLEKLGEDGDISIFDNGITALAAVSREKPDLLFLDIQMPGMTGMEVLNRVQDVPVIITSAFDQYAIDSFRLDVTDYLLKPYTLDRLRQAIDKGKKALLLRQLEQSGKQQQLTVRVDGSNEVLNLGDILYLQAEKDYVRIVLKGGRQRLTLNRLSSLEEQLPDELFVRIHRSYVINRQALSSTGAQTLTLSDGTELPIGRTYRNNL